MFFFYYYVTLCAGGLFLYYYCVFFNYDYCVFFLLLLFFYYSRCSGPHGMKPWEDLGVFLFRIVTIVGEVHNIQWQRLPTLPKTWRPAKQGCYVSHSSHAVFRKSRLVLSSYPTLFRFGTLRDIHCTNKTYFEPRVEISHRKKLGRLNLDVFRL